MKDKHLIFMVWLFLAANVNAQPGIEQYCYLRQHEAASQVQLLHYQTTKNWYIEGRYNYEDDNTGALYFGKTFSRESKFSYSITPIIGGVAGKLNGGSVGFNATADYHNFFFASQTQYTFSVEDETCNFFFSWSEVGYEIRRWVYTGVAVQQTNLFHTSTQIEPGAVLGFVLKNFTFPLYTFSPLSEHPYYVLGINFTLGTKNRITL